MRKFLRLSTAAILSVSLLICEVFANEIQVQLLRSEDSGGNITQKLSVVGKLDSFEKNEQVTLKVYPYNINPCELDDYELLEQNFIESDGSFVFNNIISNSGEYSITVNSTSDRLDYGEKIFVPELKAISDLIKGLNDKTITATQAAEEIYKNSRNLLFNAAIFNRLSKDFQTAVIDSMIKNTTEFTIENIYTQFDLYTLYTAVSSTSDAALIKDTLEIYNASYLKLENEYCYKDFADFTSEDKNKVYSLVGGTKVNGTADIKKAFSDAVIFEAYQTTPSFSTLYNIIEKYQDTLSCKDALNILNQDTTLKNKVLKYLINNKKDIKNINEFLEKLYYAINNVNSLPGSQTGSGTSSDGDGGSVKPSSPKRIKTDTVAAPIDTSLIKVVSSFEDITNYDWANKAITALYQKGILSGKEEGIFAPEDNVTRAEFIKMFALSAGINDPSVESTFEDVQGHWANTFVGSVFSKGIIMGISDNIFGVDNDITREDTAVILYRYLQTIAKSQKITTVEITFSDYSKLSDYARRSVDMMSGYGIIKGFEDGTFRPQDNLSRAEAAVLIFRYMTLLS